MINNSKLNRESLFIISNVELNYNLSNALPSQLCGNIILYCCSINSNLVQNDYLIDALPWQHTCNDY